MRQIADFVPRHVLEFESYVPSRPDDLLKRQYGVQDLHRLNNNENALGPPPSAREAIAAFRPGQGALYPSGDAFHLRHALAAAFDKDPDQFLVGNGSCEVISAVLKAFCQPGDNVVTADRTFAVYEWVASFSGIEPVLVPLRDHALDPDALLAAVTEKTKIVFLCNPNNPTGTWWDHSALERFLGLLGHRAMVVLDEAYREFVTSPDFPDAMEVMKRHSNVLCFRTFSKMYGLAAFRVGYLCGPPDCVNIVRRTHLVYSVNSVGQLAAQAALEDDGGHVAATRAMVAQARERLSGLFDSLGLEHAGGDGNFIMARVPMPDTLLYRLLMRRGVMIRTMTGFRFPNWIRVTLGLEPAMEAFAKALREALDRR